jgi:hypothetical protein
MVAGCEGGEDGECGRSGCCNVEQPLRPAIKRIQETLKNMHSKTLNVHTKSGEVKHGRVLDLIQNLIKFTLYC